MSRSLIVMMTAVLAACGAPPILARPSILRSPHRALAVFPFDYGGGAKNGAPAATGCFEAKLRADGFLIVNHGKTMNVYDASALKSGAFGRIQDAAALAQALGAKAAFVGIADDAYDRVDRRAAVYGEDARKRRIVLQPASSTRTSGLSLRVRLIDAQTAAVLWSGSYSGTLVGFPLSMVADQVTDVLNQQLTDAADKGQF